MKHLKKFNEGLDQDLLKVVISTEGEEILVANSNDNPLVSRLFPEYVPGEVIPANSIRFKKNLSNYDSRNIWKSDSRRRGQ